MPRTSLVAHTIREILVVLVGEDVVPASELEERLAMIRRSTA